MDLTKPRIWTSSSGNTFQGVMTSNVGDKVVLREVPSGRIVTVRLDQLSEADQHLLK
jgi:hypothetical protein